MPITRGGPFCLCVLLSACVGEPKVLEPRAPPPRVAPPIPVPSAPLQPGYGRVVLAGTDGRLQITARGDTEFVPPGSTLKPTRTGNLCVTPCVVDLPVGTYQLYMTSADGTYAEGDSDTLQVREGVNYYVRAPGKFEPPTWIPVAPTLIMTLATVAVLGGVVLVSGREDNQRTGGAALLVGGGIGAVVGGVMYYDASRGARQDGAATTWWQPMEQQR